MTTQATAAIKQALTEKMERVMLTTQGTRIELSDAALKQAGALLELMKKETNYDETKFVEEDFALATAFVDNFTTYEINGEVENNVLQPIPDETFESVMHHCKAQFETYPLNAVIAVDILQGLMAKHKHFYR